MPFIIARRGKAQLALSVPDPRIVALDLRRAASGMSHTELCAFAPLHPSTWFFLRAGQQQPRPDTVKRIERAIAEAKPKPPPPSAIACLMHGAETVLLTVIGRNCELIEACSWKRPRKAPPRALVPARVKRLAFYLLAVELHIPNTELAAAAGVSRQAIKQARDHIEDLRQGDARVDALLTRAAAKLKGV